MRYRFQSSQYRDQKQIEQTAGTAIRGEGAQDTRIELLLQERDGPVRFFGFESNGLLQIGLYQIVHRVSGKFRVCVVIG